MTVKEVFDLIVIGSGPGGYTAAIRAAQLGLKVASIEKYKTLGGTCLNFGCIPSKTLLDFSHKYHEAKHNFSNIGIKVDPKIDLSVMQSKKNQIITELTKGIEMLFNKNKITKISGHAKIIDPHTIEIKNHDTQRITGKNILIATGSEVINIPSIAIDEEVIVSSTGALNFPKIPKKLIVIGGGVIGLELGSVWSRLGSEVLILEGKDQILPFMDEEVVNNFIKVIQKQGMQLKLNCKVEKCVRNQDKVDLIYQDMTNNKSEEIQADAALVSIGRRPFTNGLGLDNVGITTNKVGQIQVNKSFQTNISNIYAIGDVIDGPMLAHKAEEEGIAAVENMCGLAGHVNYNIIPSIIYTHPEVASVGVTEQELKNGNINYTVGKFPFLANSRAKAVLDTDGLVKILADKKTDKILGAHIIGPDAGTLIAEMAVAMEFSASSEDIARTCHAHPTLNEAIREAALAVSKRSINF